MSPVNKQLLDILVCPRCKGHLKETDGGMAILCGDCKLKYPVRGGVPNMIVEEAIDLREGGKQPSSDVPPKGFRIAGGVNKGRVFHVEKGTCRAVGRALSNLDETVMLNTSASLSLDDSAKGLVQKYISKQFGKSAGKGEYGAFVRGSDVVLNDSSVSRLHAMIFYDEVGVGVLDLVSMNGTFVNGEEVESRLLKKGDTIEIGDTKIVYEG